MRFTFPPAVPVFDESHLRLDARRVAALFGVPLPVFAGLLGVPETVLEDNPSALGLQEPLLVYARLATVRSKWSPAVREERWQAWLKAPVCERFLLVRPPGADLGLSRQQCILSGGVNFIEQSLPLAA